MFFQFLNELSTSFYYHIPRGQLALEFLPSSSAPAFPAPAFPAPSSGASFGMSQPLTNAAALKVIEALEWLGKAKESCTLAICVVH